MGEDGTRRGREQLIGDAIGQCLVVEHDRCCDRHERGDHFIVAVDLGRIQGP